MRVSPSSMIRRIPTGRLARNTVLATGWMGVRVAAQALWVVMIARAIGPDGYGLFAGMAGLASALGALTGLGFGVLMLQDTSRDRANFPVAWKRALLLASGSGAVLWVLYLAIAPALIQTRIGILPFAAVGLPELICFPLTVLASYAFQAHERMGWAGALYVLIPVGNLLAAGAFLLWAKAPALEFYLPFHAAASVLAAVCAIALVRVLLSPPAVPFSLQRRDVREGFGFSLMRLVETGMTSLDKTLVLKLAGSEVAGIYSSAYRLVAVLAIPATSLGMAALPRLFRTYEQGREPHARLVRTLVGITFVYGILAGFAAWALSDILPFLLGQSFGPAAQAARWLALSPLLYGFYALGCNVLVTSRRRYLRVFAQAAGIALLLIAALLCVPGFGLKGAVAMLLITQAATALLLWALARFGRAASDS